MANDDEFTVIAGALGGKAICYFEVQLMSWSLFLY
tara:strand:+ start:603 stop:707 length:105 start_codon:yes stop_codon:yes gene_type:complete